MRFTNTALISAAIVLTAVTGANADINVVTSIKPVHSLVSAVMKDIGIPSLIVDGAASPHTYSLKPSQAKQLQNADLIFWMGDELEAFLEKPIEAIAKNAISVNLLESHELKKLKFREGGAFDDHGHDDHDDHDKHAKDDHDDHGHEGFDPHVWLDPVNAKAMVHEIEEALAKVDPTNAAKYQENAERLMLKMDKLINEVTADLKPVSDKGFIVFHDAYQYFEQRFNVSAIGSITVSPEVLPGAQRIAALQEKIRDLGATCVFSEPQFESKLVATVIENTNTRVGVIDPLGASIPNGPNHYFTLIKNMADALKSCLSGNS